MPKISQKSAQAEITDLKNARLAVQNSAELRRTEAWTETGQKLEPTFRGLVEAAYDLTKALRHLGVGVHAHKGRIPASDLDFRVARLYLETHPELRETFLAIVDFKNIDESVTPSDF